MKKCEKALQTENGNRSRLRPSEIKKKNKNKVTEQLKMEVCII